MKKILTIVLIVSLVLNLAACGGDKDNSNIGDTVTETEKESVTENVTSQVTPTKEPERKEESPEPETTDESKTIGGIDPDNPPVNWGTPDGPQIAVQNYYGDTVFELVSMEVLEASKEYVKFTVVTKKGGVLVDPDRTIELQYEDGAWKVMNEGY